MPIGGVCVPTLERLRTIAGYCQGAAVTVSNTANSMAYAWIAGGSGPEARLVGEVMNAVSGMRRDRAEELVHRLLKASDERAETGSERIEFPDVYDVEAERFKPDFLDDLARAKETIANLGVPFP